MNAARNSPSLYLLFMPYMRTFNLNVYKNDVVGFNDLNHPCIDVRFPPICRQFGNSVAALVKPVIVVLAAVIVVLAVSCVAEKKLKEN